MSNEQAPGDIFSNSAFVREMTECANDGSWDYETRVNAIQEATEALVDGGQAEDEAAARAQLAEEYGVPEDLFYGEA